MTPRDPYNEVGWHNGTTGGTAMSQSNFEHMDGRIKALDTALAAAEDRLAALEAIGGGGVGYTIANTFNRPPTKGTPLLYHVINARLYFPRGDAWINMDTWNPAPNTEPGGADAPDNFTAEIQPDGTTTWSGDPVTGATGYTLKEKFKSPNGVTGVINVPTPSGTRPATTSTTVREYFLVAIVGGVETAESEHVTLYYPYGSSPTTGGGTTGGGTGGGGGGGTIPMSFLGIGSGYYANLGIGLPTGHVNIPYDELAAGYTKGGYVELNTAGDGVVLTSYMNGKTTTNNTHYARNETREQDSKGANLYFAADNGTHSWEYVFGIGHIQPHKPWVTVGQIHDRKSDTMSIKMKGAIGTGGTSRTSLDIVAAFYDSDHPTKLLTGYNATLGVDAAAQVRIKVVLRSSGVVDIYCNNVLKITSNAIKDKIAADSAYRDIYWKLGLYPQAHSEYTSGSQPKEDPNEYCQGVFYSHAVSHSPSLG